MKRRAVEQDLQMLYRECNTSLPLVLLMTSSAQVHNNCERQSWHAFGNPWSQVWPFGWVSITSLCEFCICPFRLKVHYWKLGGDCTTWAFPIYSANTNWIPVCRRSCSCSTSTVDEWWATHLVLGTWGLTQRGPLLINAIITLQL